MSEICSIPVRVSEELRAKLESEAKEKECSLAAAIRMRLKESFSRTAEPQVGSAA
jgi:hypothetical protein